MPQSRNGECQIANVAIKTSMTADWICSGRMARNPESSWADPNHAVGKVHFVGNMQMGPNFPDDPVYDRVLFGLQRPGLRHRAAGTDEIMGLATASKCRSVN